MLVSCQEDDGLVAPVDLSDLELDYNSLEKQHRIKKHLILYWSQAKIQTNHKQSIVEIPATLNGVEVLPTKNYKDTVIYKIIAKKNFDKSPNFFILENSPFTNSKDHSISYIENYSFKGKTRIYNLNGEVEYETASIQTTGDPPSIDNYPCSPYCGGGGNGGTWPGGNDSPEDPRPPQFEDEDNPLGDCGEVPCDNGGGPTAENNDYEICMNGDQFGCCRYDPVENCPIPSHYYDCVENNIWDDLTDGQKEYLKNDDSEVQTIGVFFEDNSIGPVQSNCIIEDEKITSSSISYLNCEMDFYDNCNQLLENWEELPCPNDPFLSHSITPSGGWNIPGGRFGVGVRNNGRRDHNGIDLSASPNSKLFSVFSGEVIYVDNDLSPNEWERNSYGNVVKVKSIISGDIVEVMYAHLNDVIVQVGDNIYHLEQIGVTGLTGNAQDNPYRPGNDAAIPHVHIEIKVNGQRVDPEIYLGTKFDNLGNEITNECQ